MNPSTPRDTRLFSLLTTTLLFVGLGMTLFEAVKSWLLPDLTTWQSRGITIAFTTSLATVVTFLVFRRLTALVQRKQARWLRAEQMVERAPEGILTISSRGQLLSLNPAAEQFFGYGAA